MLKKLQSTYSKLFIFLFSNRRNFIPILSIYFLSIENTTANQIWIYTSIWFLLWFLFEVPSGYFADNFWHKKTLVLSKLSMLFSTISFLIWWIYFPEYAFLFFTLGSILISVWFSFSSWTFSAYLHEILEKEWKKDNFSKASWKMKANVSLLSMFFILALPFFTKIDIFTPLLISLWIDLIWLWAILTIKKSDNSLQVSKENRKSIKQIFFEAKKLWFIPISIFLWSASWFILWATAFRTVYLEELWLPIIFMWFVMWLSRFFWFIIWNHIHKIEKYVNIKKLLFIEIFIFSSYFLLSAYFSNPYLVWFFMAIVLGYMFWRESIITNHLLNNYLPDKRYKASLLSLNKQTESIISVLVSFLIGFVMTYSYKLWYAILGIFVLLFMSISYYFIFRKKNI